MFSSVEIKIMKMVLTETTLQLDVGNIYYGFLLAVHKAFSIT